MEQTLAIGTTLRSVACVLALAALQTASVSKVSVKKGYDITPTGLVPAYPKNYACSPLTSLYASWIDVDGTRRDELHSGIDGGRLGEKVLAPAPGTVRAAWKANWQWGDEGALLIRHTREDLNLDQGPPYYYSAFYHLKYDDVRGFKEGQRIERGQTLAKVFRPGGKAIYLPEVHLEVYEVRDDGQTTWNTNKYGAPDWDNDTARLIDPLYLMALHAPPSDDIHVEVQPFAQGLDFAAFPGFSYILPCRKK
jgi:murein DD-endopeptidase MepM/ murein hydrolase activator NlpD